LCEHLGELWRHCSVKNLLPLLSPWCKYS
jgi:hypothetical protein